MLSPLDDYPFHQIPDVIRHVGTSDRNFYDRYYFNMHSSSGELFMVMGMGQYPNLGVQDAFAVIRRGSGHHVVRASREITDRSDTVVGPFHIEIIEGLQKLRFVLEDTPDHPVAADLVWEASVPAFLEPRQFIRRHGRVIFDTSRFAQTGCWSGTLRVGDERFEVTPDRWWGSRDRSWGVRPVGEGEPPGIQAGTPAMQGMWNYCPMQFKDYSILYMNNENDDGSRELEEAVLIPSDPAKEPVQLGRPEHDHRLNEQRNWIEEGVIRFPDAPDGALEVRATPLEFVYVMVGTGYGLETDWRHGMYQGRQLKVESFSLDTDRDRDRMPGMVDTVSRFETSTGDTGYGLFEWLFLPPFKRYGIG